MRPMSPSIIRPDAEIAAEVLDSLRRSADVDEREVGVQVADGVVTLTGTVGSHTKRIAALRAARHVGGVLRVLDAMRVAVPSMEDALRLLVNRLECLHAAEQQGGKLLSELAEAASSPKLAAALRTLARQSSTRLTRLGGAFEELGKLPPTPLPQPASAYPDGAIPGPNGFCRGAMQLARASGAEPAVRDAALIAIAEHMAHERIAGYVASKTLAGILAFDDTAHRLQESLSEERHTDAELARLADALVERAAAGRANAATT